MVVNVFAAYAIYMVAVIFSHAIWLGLFAAFFFWIGQLIFHGVITTSQLKYPYNPGLLTTVIGVALGIYYVYYVSHHHLTSVWDWVGAVALLPVFAVVVMVKLTFTWLADKDSPCHFTDAEMHKWSVPHRRHPAADTTGRPGPDPTGLPGSRSSTPRPTSRT